MRVLVDHHHEELAQVIADAADAADIAAAATATAAAAHRVRASQPRGQDYLEGLSHHCKEQKRAHTAMARFVEASLSQGQLERQHQRAQLRDLRESRPHLCAGGQCIGRVDIHVHPQAAPILDERYDRHFCAAH